MKVIVFDIWGDYGHFKKRYTTTSPLTHSIPPRTTVMGLISAIAGLKKDEYQEYFSRDKSKLALQILNPVKKVRFSLNLISTKSEHLIAPPLLNYFKRHTIITYEFLKDPKYRIYFYHEDNNFYNTLRNLLIEHKSIYTPALGLSELICNFGWIGEYYITERKNSHELTYISSILPIKKSSDGKSIMNIKPEKDKKYSLETVPYFMNASREVEEYIELLIEENGKTINTIPETYWELEDGTKIIPF